MVLIKIGIALLGAIVGMVVSYFAGASAACGLLWPESNLCGLPAVFVALPLGIVAGAIVGWLIARRLVAAPLS
jgi:hypothetical protein